MAEVAPAIEAQPAPAVSQRCHWYEYAGVGVPVHVPVVEVSDAPTVAVPETVGGAVFAGSVQSGPVPCACSRSR